MNSNNKQINRWPINDRPREKLHKNGEHTLSNSELLAILLRTGIKGESAIDLARNILCKFKTFRNMSHSDNSAWNEIKGLGPAKIAQIKAALEIGRRFREDEVNHEKIQIKCSKDVYDLLYYRMRDLKKEIFKTVFLNSKNEIIEIFDVIEGTVNQANPIIREIFHHALTHFACAIICVHNHPSGQIKPSQEDSQFTRNLFSASKIMEIKLIDHIIIGHNNYYSFADNGEIVN